MTTLRVMKVNEFEDAVYYRMLVVVTHKNMI